MILAVEVFGRALLAAVTRPQTVKAALACGKDKRPPEVTPATFIQFVFLQQAFSTASLSFGDWLRGGCELGAVAA